MATDILAKLDFSNISDHPTNASYNVYRFYIKEQADLFESLVQKAGVEYERADDTDTGRLICYFGIHKRSEREVLKLNHYAIGKYRTPFFSNRLGGWVLIIVVALIIALAVVGYVVANAGA